MPAKETTGLLSSSSSDASSKYYFLGKSNTNYHGGTSESVRDGDGEQVVEGIPEGATVDEFAPRQLSRIEKHPSMNKSTPAQASPSKRGGGQRQAGAVASRGANRSFLAKLFGRKRPARSYGEVGTLMKQRKAPVKIEPKVFFANERTFLAWMHLSVVLAGASIAILAFAEENNPFSQMYGVILLPVAIAFIVYSMYQYARRAAMIRHRHPGPYEDTVGPTVLGCMLMISIIAQFSIKLYSLSSE